MAEQHRDTMPGWASLALRIVDGLSFDAPGRKVLKVYHAVNFHKIFTAFLIFAMMYWYDNWSIAVWVYAALHGIYGYCWLIKDFGFRDHQLEAGISLPGTIGLYAGLIGLYWIIPWLYISHHVVPGNFDLFFAICLHTLGVVAMIASDCQRHFTLKHRKGLITEGMFRYTRNPNYLGEVMLYSSYAYLAEHWLAWALIAYMTFFAFLPRLYRKDVSLSRHPGWRDYKNETGLLVPWALVNGRALRNLFRGDHAGSATATESP